MKKPVKKTAMGGLMGIIPMAIEHMQSKKRKDRRRSGEGPSEPSAPTGVTGMKKGGKVGRGDGACIKGRTKGKMV